MSNGGTVAPAIHFAAITFDRPDPAEPARFHEESLSMPVAPSHPDLVPMCRDGAAGPAFHRPAGHRRPTWPDPGQEKQAHPEPGVDDLDAAQPPMPALGAVEPDSRPQPDRWRVPVDPAGHPFCLTKRVRP